MDKTTKALLAVVAVCILVKVGYASWSSGSDRTLLKDVSTLTLTRGKYTAGRRSSPVPQLQCVGGSAMSEYAPEVVQCYNRGTDGHDVQWECKADMDHRYKFGRVEVTCEGYEHPDDPYVLKGSCGLEYTMEHAPGAYNQNSNSQHNSNYGYDNSYKKHSKASNVFGDLITLAIIAVIVYAIYRTCLSQRNHSGTDRMPRPDDHHSSRPHNTGNPGYGFKPEYTDSTGSCGANTSTGTNAGYAGTGNAGGGGGFWTGAMTGGLLGYLFGNRGGQTYTQNPYGHGYQQPHYRSNSWFSGFGGSSFGSSGRSSGFGGSSFGSSTRSTSGFGGTKRR